MYSSPCVVMRAIERTECRKGNKGRTGDIGLKRGGQRSVEGTYAIDVADAIEGAEAVEDTQAVDGTKRCRRADGCRREVFQGSRVNLFKVIIA